MSDEEILVEDEDLLERRPVINDETISMIARMPEFHLLTREEVAHIAELEPHIFKREEIIINPDDAGSRILVVLLAGECRVEKSIPINSEKVWVNIEDIHAPAMLGEIGVFSSLPRTARVVSSNRSVVLLVPAETLRAHFKRSKATFPQMLWSFAQLGLLRANAGAERFTKLYKERIDCGVSEDSGFAMKIRRLQELLGDEGENSAVTEETIDNISVLLDKVDHALALVRFFDKMEDRAMPENVQELERISSTLTSLAVATVQNSGRQGNSIKKSIIKTCANGGNYCGGAGDWATCLELMIHATDDLSRLTRTEKGRSNDRKVEPGTEEMVLGFADRIEKELDDLQIETLEKFKIKSLPEKLDGSGDLSMLEDFLEKGMGNIMSRTSMEDFETDIFAEYFRAGSDTRDSVARNLYGKLSRHPVVMLLVPESCGASDAIRVICEQEDSSLLDFLCFGYQLLYQSEKSDPGDGADIGLPYPV